MNKKLQKGLVAAVAATLSTGIVAPVYAASVETKSFDAQYAEAYNATVNAKTQKELTAARVLVDKLYADLPQDLKNLAATLSAILDPKQQTELVKLDNAIKAAEVSGKQTDVNVATALIVDMPTVWKTSFSSYMDKIQQAVINKAVAAVTKAQESGIQADFDAAKALYEELLTVTNNDGVKSWVETALKAELDKVVVAVKISSVTPVGAKKLEVKFNQPVDTTKAVITVKKGSVATNLEKVTFSADKTSATIETTTKLTKTDTNTLYAVTVKGLANELSATASVEEEKVSKIEVTSTTAPMTASGSTTATVRYQVLNQYGENVTKDYTNINWTASTGWTSPSGSTNGQLTISAASGATAFIPGTKVYVTGVYANTTNGNSAVVNAEVTIGLEAKADKVVFNGIYQSSDKVFDANFTNANGFQLLYSVLDQYGNEMAVSGVPAVVFTNNNPLLLTIPQNPTSSVVTVDGEDYFALPITRGDYTSKGGNATVLAISSTTGKQSSYDISLDAVSAVKSFTMSAPADIVAQDETVEVPFTALDQNGNAVTKYADLNGKLTLSAALSFVEKADGNAKLVYTAPTSVSTIKGLQTVTSLVKDGGNFSSLTIDVKEKAVAKVVIGLDSTVSTNVSLGGALTIVPTDLVYQDQYGRVIADANITAGTNVHIKYKTTIDGVVSGWTTYTASTDFYNAKLTKVEFALFDTVGATTPITGSNKVFNVTVSGQSTFASYEIADPGVMFNNGVAGDGTTADVPNTNYDKTLKVYGIKEDGTKVLLADTYYTVAAQSGSQLSVTSAGVISDLTVGGYAAADFDDEDGNAINLKETVKVTILDTATPGAIKEVLTKEITISDAAPKGETVTMKDTLVNNRYEVTAANGETLLNTLAGLAVKEVKDQYGIVMTPSATVTIKNVTKATGSSFAVVAGKITGSRLGDKFTAEFKYGSKVVTADFVIKADSDVTAPSLTSISGKTIAANGNIVVTFSEAIDAASQTAVVEAIKAVDPSDATYAWTTPGTVLTIGSVVGGTFSSDVTVSVTDSVGNTNATLALDLN